MKWKEIIKAAYVQLFGKDSLSGNSFLYTWCADQVGHFSLGFFPTALLYWLLENNSCYIPLSISVIWILKELFDLYNATKNNKNSIFPIPYKSIWENIICTWVYFGLGIFTAFSAISLNLGWPIIIALILGILYSKSWLILKIYLDKSELPYFFRLCSFSNQKIDNNDFNLVHELISGKNGNYIILGPKNTGKTLLGCGIITEYLMKSQPAKYITFNKWVENKEAFSEDILVIDDVCPIIGDPEQSHFYIENLLNGIIIDPNKTYIWIIGGHFTESDIWKSIFKADNVIELLA